MKTAKEVLMACFRVKDEETLDDVLCGRDMSMCIGDIEYVMIKYAEQVLDYAAQEAETTEDCGNPYDPNDYFMVVDEQSILKIKKQLK